MERGYFIQIRKCQTHELLYTSENITYETGLLYKVNTGYIGVSWVKFM